MWELSLVCDFMRKFVGTGSKGKPHVSSKSAMTEHNLHLHANYSFEHNVGNFLVKYGCKDYTVKDNTSLI